MKKTINILILFLIVFNLSWAKYDQGDKMIDFTLDGLDNATINLYQDYIGQTPVIIDFWATWCPPCVRAMPALNGLQENLGTDYLNVIAVSVDSENTIGNVEPFVSSKGFTMTIALAKDSRVPYELELSSIPATYLLDFEGNIVYKGVGYSPGLEKEFEKIIDKLWKERKESASE